MTAGSAAVSAFREAWLQADLPAGDSFCDYEARRLRYALYWAMYENTAYRDIHAFSRAMRRELGLYRYTRGIYNPSYRLGETWQMLLWGGRLNLEDPAGGALPIVASSAAVPPAIGRLWQYSNWQINKDLLVLYGVVLGDGAIQVVDDVARGKVYLDVLHPGVLKEVTLDPYGNVKAYTREEQRPDPLGKRQAVTYTEEASRDGDQVVYRTYLDGSPYAWNGVTYEWAEPYGFVPLVVQQHNNVGLPWGWSELHAGRTKFFEADDLSSKLSDQVRKMVDSPWLFSGVEKPKTAPFTTGASPSDGRPEPGREEVPALYGPAGADAKPLVADLNVADVAAYIKDVLAGIEQDYPELQMDIWTLRGDTSARALRTARQRVEAKVVKARARYDDALVRAQMMALSIGGLRGYQGFESFGLDSYAAGDLSHTIGERPVFPKDPMDEIEVSQAFWTAAVSAVKAGAPLLTYLEDAGWDEERIARILATPEYQARLAALRMLGGGDEG